MEIIIKCNMWTKYICLGETMYAYGPVGFQKSLVINISKRNRLVMTRWNYANNPI